MASGEPSEQNNKHLYLFEVLVKNIDINRNLLNEDEKDLVIKNPIRVRIIFSDFYDVEIDEVKDCKSIHLPEPEQVKCHSKMSRTVTKEKNGKEKTKQQKQKEKVPEELLYVKKTSLHSQKAGFSCLFPMLPMEMLEKLKTSSLYFVIFSNMGENEAKKIIGQAKVDVRKNFIDSVQYASVTGEFPTTANLTTSCKIENVYKEVSGRIEVYVRLSCFGKFIMSMFNMLNNDRNPAKKKTDEEEEEEEGAETTS